MDRPATMRWKVLRLASVGFFVNFQPSEPFLTWYLLHRKGVSERALNAVVWPCDTYGALAFTLPMALYAERLGYRRALVLGMACREATRLLLLYARGAAAMAAMQLTYAGAIAAHDAVFVAHAVACVPMRRAAAAAAYVTAACKLGDALGSLAGQCMRGFGGESRPLASADALFYVSWASTTVGAASLVFLSPRPVEGIFKRDRWSAEAARAALRDPRGLAWSGWWIASVGVHAVASNYVQELLAEATIHDDRAALYGVLECVAGLGSCVGAALARRAPRGLWVPAAIAAVVGALDALSALLARRHRPWLFIAAVVGRHACFGFGFAAACAGIATAAAPSVETDGAVVSPLQGEDDDDGPRPEPPPARCALVYGANTTLALVLAAGLQWVLAARRASAPAYFLATAAIQAAFAALAPCVFR